LCVSLCTLSLSVRVISVIFQTTMRQTAFIEVALALLVLFAAWAPSTEAVDRNKFKTCDRSGFCRRQRALGSSDAQALPTAYRVHLRSMRQDVTDSSLVRGLIEESNDAHGAVLLLEVRAYADNVVRVTVDELPNDAAALLHLEDDHAAQAALQRWEADAADHEAVREARSRPRYRVQEVLQEEAMASRRVPFESVQLREGGALPSLLTLQYRGADGQRNRVEIDEHLQVRFLADDQPVLTANQRGLFSFEHRRPSPARFDQEPQQTQQPQAEQDEQRQDEQDEQQQDEQDEQQQQDKPAERETEQEGGVAKSKVSSRYRVSDVESDGAWEESFGNHKDEKPYGPNAIGLDLTFHGVQHVYGLPEHADSLALRDTRSAGGAHLLEPYRLFNLDVFEFELEETMALYGHVPVMYGHRGDRTTGVFWLNAAEMWVDVASSEDRQHKHTHWMAESGVLDLFVMLAASPRAAVASYTGLTGTQALPPKFAIAYHQCRWNYRDEADVSAVHAGFDQHDIPFDVLWLDIEHTDGKRYFTWDQRNFATPKRMQEELWATGRRMVTIVDPHIKRDSGYAVHQRAEEAGVYVLRDGQPNAPAYDGWCWPGSSSWVDYVSATARQWWADQFAYDRYQGSTPSLFTWNDMNEPSVFNGPETTIVKHAVHAGGWENRDLHNLYGMLMQRATAEGQVQRNEGHTERPFVLSRAFFAGTQRHGAIWTGDNAARWDHMGSASPMLLSVGLGGIGFCGADVGGFFGDPQPELLLRWYQAGAFQPFFRAHGHLDTKRREPWLFGEPWTTRFREAIRQRYVYLQHWYTLFREAELTGAPPMRPLFFEFPREQAIFALDDQYLVGADLLVAPVTSAGATSRQVYLPGVADGTRWFDVHTLREVRGPQLLADAPLDRTPVFQRGGSVIARQERARRSSEQMANDPFTLQICVDRSGAAAGELYLDDGHSFAYQRSGAFAQRRFELSTESGRNVAILRNLDVTPLAGTDAEKQGRQLFAASVRNHVERIRVLGLEKRVEKVQLTLEEGSTHQLQFSLNDGVLLIRKPQLPILQQWSVSIVWA